MAVKPQDALKYIGTELKEKINELESALDNYLNLNYCGEELDINLNKLESNIKNKEILNKNFYTNKVLFELKKRYEDWDIKEDLKPTKLSLKFSEKNTDTNKSEDDGQSNRSLNLNEDKSNDNSINSREESVKMNDTSSSDTNNSHKKVSNDFLTKV